MLTASHELLNEGTRFMKDCLGTLKPTSRFSQTGKNLCSGLLPFIPPPARNCVYYIALGRVGVTRTEDQQLFKSLEVKSDEGITDSIRYFIARWTLEYKP